MQTVLEADVSARIKPTAAYRQILAEESAAKLADRESLVAELGVIDSNLAAVRPALAERLELAEKLRGHVAKKLQAAQSERDEAAGKLFSADSEANFRRGQIRAKLESSAPPEIDAFLKELTSREEQARAAFVSRSTPSGKYSASSDLVDIHTNAERISGILGRCRAARTAAVALKLTAMPKADVVEAIAKLKSEL